MAQELLGDVLRAGDSGGRARRWSVLPLSVAAHTAAAAAILIIPVAAEVELPAPMRPAQRIFHVVAEAPRPVVVPVRGAQPAPHTQYAPSEAPFRRSSRKRWFQLRRPDLPARRISDRLERPVDSTSGMSGRRRS